jgi:hypothetical protein
MPLINCYECGKQISDAAPSCPSCGAPKILTPAEVRRFLADDSLGKRADDGLPKCPLCGGKIEKMIGREIEPDNRIKEHWVINMSQLGLGDRCALCGYLVNIDDCLPKRTFWQHVFKPKPTKTKLTPSLRASERLLPAARESSYWSYLSNGYKWKNATHTQKKWICDKMASASNKGGTASYYINFFNNFYGSPATGGTSMSDAVRLAESQL